VASTDLLLALFVVGGSFFAVAIAYDQIAKRIRGSEERYREVFDTAADGIVVMDSDNRIVLFNGQAELVFGYRAQEVIGEPLGMLIPERFREVHRDHVQGFAEGSVSWRSVGAGRVLTGLRSNGEELPIEVTISKRPVDGTFEFTAMVRDVTERQRAAEQRELIQECVTAIAESQDVNTALAVVLRRVCEYTGWLMGEAWIPSADGSRLEASDAFYSRSEGLDAFRKVTESVTFEPGVGLPGRVWNSKRPFVIPDLVSDPGFVGRDLVAPFGIRAAVAVPALAGDEVVAILLFLLEAPPLDSPQLVDTISAVAAQLGSSIQRRLAEDALRVSEARYRGMLEAIPDLVFRLSSDGTYLSFQVPDVPGFFPLPERFIGKRIDEALSPELAGELASVYRRAQESGEVQLWQYQFSTGDQLRDREARVFPIPGSDETMAIVRDITEQLHAQRALEASLRSKNELIASIAHELRTPLTAVVGFTQILRDQSGLSGEERTEMIRLIAEEGADLTNIVEDLLTAAKAEAGTLTVVHVPVDLRAQAAQILETFWDGKEAGRLELTGTAVRAFGDPARVRQILRNLISNALKYGGNSIRINTSSDETTSRVTVSDDGPGVLFDQQERIFESYERAHDTSGLTSSLGLGLTISRHLARLMRGDLTYRHQGKTIFELTLPRAT
jgi:PAS domain S-box-containing protein